MEELKEWLQEEHVLNTSDTTNKLKDDQLKISQNWSERKEAITKEWILLRKFFLHKYISFQVTIFTILNSKEI